jgi:hypothetical protein
MRGLQKAATALVALVTASCAVASCLAPTETKLEISTDIDCTRQLRTAIYVNPPTDDIDPTAPVTETSQCSGGTIGSLVIVPRHVDAPFQIDVLTALGDMDPAGCYASPASCVFSRRRLPESLPHASIDLPVEQFLACIGVVCDPASTCYQGNCVPNEVDPTQCTGPGGCQLSSDGGVPPDASGHDANGRDVASVDGIVADTASDQGLVAEGAPQESGASDSPPEGAGPDAGPPGDASPVDGSSGFDALAPPDGGSVSEASFPPDGSGGFDAPVPDGGAAFDGSPPGGDSSISPDGM